MRHWENLKKWFRDEPKQVYELREIIDQIYNDMIQKNCWKGNSTALHFAAIDMCDHRGYMYRRASNRDKFHLMMCRGHIGPRGGLLNDHYGRDNHRRLAEIRKEFAARFMLANPQITVIKFGNKHFSLLEKLVSENYNIIEIDYTDENYQPPNSLLALLERNRNIHNKITQIITDGKHQELFDKLCTDLEECSKKGAHWRRAKSLLEEVKEAWETHDDKQIALTRIATLAKAQLEIARGQNNYLGILRIKEHHKDYDSNVLNNFNKVMLDIHRELAPLEPNDLHITKSTASYVTAALQQPTLNNLTHCTFDPGVAAKHNEQTLRLIANNRELEKIMWVFASINLAATQKTRAALVELLRCSLLVSSATLALSHETCDYTIQGKEYTELLSPESEEKLENTADVNNEVTILNLLEASSARSELAVKIYDQKPTTEELDFALKFFKFYKQQADTPFDHLLLNIMSYLQEVMNLQDQNEKAAVYLHNLMTAHGVASTDMINSLTLNSREKHLHVIEHSGPYVALAIIAVFSLANPAITAIAGLSAHTFKTVLHNSKEVTEVIHGALQCSSPHNFGCFSCGSDQDFNTATLVDNFNNALPYSMTNPSDSSKILKYIIKLVNRLTFGNPATPLIAARTMIDYLRGGYFADGDQKENNLFINKLFFLLAQVGYANQPIIHGPLAAEYRGGLIVWNWTQGTFTLKYKSHQQAITYSIEGGKSINGDPRPAMQWEVDLLKALLRGDDTSNIIEGVNFEDIAFTPFANQDELVRNIDEIHPLIREYKVYDEFEIERHTEPLTNEAIRLGFWETPATMDAAPAESEVFSTGDISAEGQIKQLKEVMGDQQETINELTKQVDKLENTNAQQTQDIKELKKENEKLGQTLLQIQQAMAVHEPQPQYNNNAANMRVFAPPPREDQEDTDNNNAGSHHNQANGR